MIKQYHSFLGKMMLASIIAGMAVGQAGCTTAYRNYTGEARPKSEVAMMLLGGGMNENVSRFVTLLVSIDGAAIPQAPVSAPYARRLYRVEVLPGEHTFIFDCYFQVGGTATLPGEQRMGLEASRNRLSLDHSEQAARFNVLAGHAYQVRYSLIGTPGFGATKLKSLDVTDSDTQKIVFHKDIAAPGE